MANAPLVQVSTCYVNGFNQGAQTKIGFADFTSNTLNFVGKEVRQKLGALGAQGVEYRRSGDVAVKPLAGIGAAAVSANTRVRCFIMRSTAATRRPRGGTAAFVEKSAISRAASGVARVCNPRRPVGPDRHRGDGGRSAGRHGLEVRGR